MPYALLHSASINGLSKLPAFIACWVLHWQQRSC